MRFVAGSVAVLLGLSSAAPPAPVPVDYGLPAHEGYKPPPPVAPPGDGGAGSGVPPAARPDNLPPPPIDIKQQNLLVNNDGPGRYSSSRVLEPSYCLKAPFQSEDNNRWEIGAGASVEDKFVRLTTAQASRTGTLWSRLPCKMTDWEINIEFAIHGRNDGGGEGFAFWYSNTKAIGPVFGNADYWDGIAVVFDTFNNDGQGASPLISVLYNDGSMSYSAFDDGQSQSLGTCTSDLRNLGTTAMARLTYTGEKFTVEISKESNGGYALFRPCVVVNLRLGLDGHFGFTASTGAPSVGNLVADYHDLFRVETYNLTPKTMTETEREQRREAYKRERETEHKQAKNHVELTDAEFHQYVVTSLHQIQGQLSGMDEARRFVEERVRLGVANGGGPDTTAVTESRDLIQRALQGSQTLESTFSRAASSNGAAGGYTGGNGGVSASAEVRQAAEALNGVRQGQTQIQASTQEIMTAMHRLEGIVSSQQQAGQPRARAGGAGGGGGGLDADSLQHAVHNGLAAPLSSAQNSLHTIASKTTEMHQALTRMEYAVNAKISQRGYSDDDEEGGGSNWGLNLVLICLIAAGGMTLSSQIKANSDYNRSKWH